MKSSKFRILITGGEGLVGSCLSEVLAGYSPVVASKHMLDITDPQKTLTVIKDIKPHVVFHLAAYTNVNGSEENPRAVFSINGLGTKNICIACRETGSIIIYVSTDFVFDGENEIPYKEFDSVNPLSVYGKSKLLGEYYVEHLTEKFIIVRTSKIFGKNGENFASKLPQYLRDKISLSVSDDLVNSPTYAPDLASALKTLWQKSFIGKIHFCNTGWCSWFDFAKYISELLNLGTKKIRPVSFSQLKEKAPRPKFSALDTQLFSSLFYKPRPWQESVRQFLKIDE